jgi:DNA invertase Pin-like site-specific DNA recombinase
MMRAVLYTRLSKEERARGGVSLAVQAEVCRAHAYAHALDVAETITDDGVSAGIPIAQRPGGARLVAALAAGGIGAVVALKLDRVFRDAIDALTVVRGWTAQGVVVHLLDVPGVDMSSAAGRFQLTVLAGVAEHERNRIRERTREALAYKRRHGRVYARIPLGFRRACACPPDAHTGSARGRPADCQTLVPVDTDQATVAAARRMRDAGYSYRRIATVLARLDRPTSRGGAWRASTVRGMLRNPIHVGDHA